MGTFEHPTSAGETSCTPSEPGRAGRPTSQPSREEGPRQADGPLAEWEYLWIDLGGEG
jgi:hypothetical protein